MTYGDFIQELRIQSGDLSKSVAADWVANGETKVLLLPLLTYPIVADSYVLKLAGVALTETTDYTIDLETGRIELVDMPTDGDIFEFTGQRVALTDEAWVIIINDVIRSMSEAFFKEITDIATYTTTANMRSISLADFIGVYDIGWFPAGSNNRVKVSNWRWSADEQKLYFGDYAEFSVTGRPLYIRGLKKYTLGTVSTDTLDMQDRFLSVLKLGCIAQYWRYKIRENVETISKITQETTRTAIQELIMLADRWDRWFQIEWTKLAPPRPSYSIPVRVPGKPLP